MVDGGGGDLKVDTINRDFTKEDKKEGKGK